MLFADHDIFASPFVLNHCVFYRVFHVFFMQTTTTTKIHKKVFFFIIEFDFRFCLFYYFFFSIDDKKNFHLLIRLPHVNRPEIESCWQNKIMNRKCAMKFKCICIRFRFTFECGSCTQSDKQKFEWYEMRCKKKLNRKYLKYLHIYTVLIVDCNQFHVYFHPVISFCVLSHFTSHSLSPLSFFDLFNSIYATDLIALALVRISGI